MGQIEPETTQDGLEGSVAPLGLSRSASNNRSEGTWTPVIRKVLAITLGGIALAAIGAVSMAHQASSSSAAQHVSASVAGVEPLEWLALNGATSSASATSVAPHPPSEHTATHPERRASPNGSAAPSSPPTPDNDQNQSGILPDGRVVLNLATISDLRTLPGIGEKRAQSILALRERLGGFKKLSELLRVKGIGVKSLRKLEPKLTIDPPKASPTAPTPKVASTSDQSSNRLPQPE